MGKINERIMATFCAAFSGFLVLVVYIWKHTVPLTDIYLSGDRTSHIIVVFICGLAGALILIALKKVKSGKDPEGGKVGRFIGYGISFLLMAGMPALLFFTQARSFRGIEWALETFIIGIVPILFIYAAFLVYFKNKIVSLFLVLIFTLFSVYHTWLLIRILPRFGKAFSTTGTSDILILISLIAFSALFAFVGYRQYLSFRK